MEPKEKGNSGFKVEPEKRKTVGGEMDKICIYAIVTMTLRTFKNLYDIIKNKLRIIGTESLGFNQMSSSRSGWSLRRYIYCHRK